MCANAISFSTCKKDPSKAEIGSRSGSKYGHQPDYALDVLSISSLAKGGSGEHRRHDGDGKRLDIDAQGWRSSVRRSTSLGVVSAFTSQLTRERRFPKPKIASSSFAGTANQFNYSSI